MSQYMLVTYQSPQGPRAGLVIGQAVFDVAAATGHPSYVTMLDVLRDWDTARGLLQDASAAPKKSDGRPLETTMLLAPVPPPAAFFCPGAISTAHMRKMAQVKNLKPEPAPHSVGL